MATLTTTERELLATSAEIGIAVELGRWATAAIAEEISRSGHTLNALTVGELRRIVHAHTTREPG